VHKVVEGLQFLNKVYKDLKGQLTPELVKAYTGKLSAAELFT